MAVQSRGGRVLGVDAMSSDVCPVHMLTEREDNIHSSNQGQVRTGFFTLHNTMRPLQVPDNCLKV